MAWVTGNLSGGVSALELVARLPWPLDEGLAVRLALPFATVLAVLLARGKATPYPSLVLLWVSWWWDAELALLWGSLWAPWSLLHLVDRLVRSTDSVLALLLASWWWDAELDWELGFLKAHASLQHLTAQLVGATATALAPLSVPWCWTAVSASPLGST